MNIKKIKGFTLVELLIVIGLLGAIAIIVIAAINPVEQANRARDARYQTSALELSKAIDRYYAGRNSFPWVIDAPGTESYTNTDDFGYRIASGHGVGLCTSDCTSANQGELVTGSELKPEFAERDFIEAAAASGDEMMVGKETGPAGAVYVCYTPVSDTGKEKAEADTNVFTLGASGVRTPVAAPSTTCGDDWPTAGCFTCVPF